MAAAFHKESIAREALSARDADQLELFGAGPGFYLGLALKSCGAVGVRLGVGDALYGLRAGIVATPPLLMLFKAADDVGSDARVEGAVRALEDVEKIHVVMV